MPVRNSCDCHNPPGGRVVCPPNQAAICIVKDGVASHECHNPPTTANAAVIVNWALTRITGVRHSYRALVEDTSLQMLLSGSFDRGTGERVTFAFPESVTNVVQSLTLTRMISKKNEQSPPTAQANY
jgi:hypothetical protein